MQEFCQKRILHQVYCFYLFNWLFEYLMLRTRNMVIIKYTLNATRQKYWHNSFWMSEATNINRVNKVIWCFTSSHKTLYFNSVFGNKIYYQCNNYTYNYFKPVCNFSIIDLNNLNALVVSSEDWSMMSNFYNSFDLLKYLVCNICNEIRFDI